MTVALFAKVLLLNKCHFVRQLKDEKGAGCQWILHFNMIFLARFLHSLLQLLKVPVLNALRSESAAFIIYLMRLS